jgi:hypothetical protein
MFVEFKVSTTGRKVLFNIAHILRVLEGQPNVTCVVSVEWPNGHLVEGNYDETVTKIMNVAAKFKVK